MPQQPQTPEGIPAEALKTFRSSGNVQSVSLPVDGQDWPFGTHYTEIPTMAKARCLLGPSSETTRKQRSRVYFNAMPNQARTRLRLGLHDRGEEYVFADGCIHESDIAGQNRHLPLHVKVIRLHEYHIGKDGIFDVSSSHTYWPGLHYREELYVYVHIDRLIVEAGARLEVHGNIFVLCCDEIILAGDHRHYSDMPYSARPKFDIRILATPHAAFGQVRRHPAYDGDVGKSGNNGQGSYATRMIATPFGPRLECNSDDLHGEPGQDGINGGHGTHGQNGGLAMLADIRIGALKNFKAGDLRIFGQGGRGREGGQGGHGGNGGNGGAGANGLDGIDGLLPGGSGGLGGNGGNGGNGGRGGNGGLSSNIFVQIPATFVNCLNLCPRDSLGGLGGKGGNGGNGGQGGKNGAFYSMQTTSSQSNQTLSANNGARGVDGHDGNCGRSRDGPKIHVFTEE